MVSDMAGRWDSGLAGGLTVQIAPLAGDAAAPPLAERVEAALTVLRATPGVRGAEALDDGAMARLLEPWLGPDAASDPNLRTPALIDVTTDGPVDVTALADRLRGAGPRATLDDHGVWLADLRAFAGAVKLAALAVVALVGGAGVLAVVFAVRAGLAIHHGVVQLLHLMGASDRYVSRQFERHVLVLTLRGGGVGLGLGAATLLALQHAGEGVRASLLPNFALTPVQWIVLTSVPLSAAALAAATARWTVLRALERLP